MERNETEAKKTDKSNNEESEGTALDLYFGLFFDGTNNNKYQTMLGKMFRRKEIFEKAIERQHPGQKFLQYNNDEQTKINSVEELLKLSRADVEEKFPGVFTKSELEFLYYGYGNINNKNDKSYNTFIERNNAVELGGKSDNRLSSKPDDVIERATLQVTAKELAQRKETDPKAIESFKGAAAQNVTYTNVAILESLYKCNNVKDNDDGQIKERHISIYIEGSGSDMQFEASTKNGYKSTIGLAGLGLGTGPSGVVGKIRKASMMVQHTLDKYQYVKDVTSINLHFDLYGFSRGATCARVMAYLINSNPNNDKAYSSKDAILTKTDDFELLTSKNKEFLPIDGKIKTKEIRFMGLFDTVSSIGVIDENYIISKLCEYINETIKAEKESNKKDIPTLWYSIRSKILPACKYAATYIGEKGGKAVGRTITQSIPVVGPALGDLGGIIGEKAGGIIGDFFGEKVGNFATDKIGSKINPIIEEIEKYVQDDKYRDKGTEDIIVITKGKSVYHRDNVKDYGLWATSLAKDVVHVCALDEVRQNFALVDIESSLKEGTGKSIEVFIPGCHTDIGGGASIGIEGEKIINKGYKKYLTSFYVHSKSWLEKDNGVLLKPINVKSMKEIGWLNPDSKKPGFFSFSVTGRAKLDEDETYYCDNTIPANIIMYRHVSPGYSNVALNYMKERSVEETFKAIPRAYRVPKGLNDLYEQLKKINDSGRYFVYPNKFEQYAELRRKFIHFSFNEQWLDVADNALVNGPEYTTIDNSDNGHIKVISRIIYPGIADAKPMHMLDYEEGHLVQIHEEDNPPQSGLHPLLSGDYSGFEEYDTSLDRLIFNPA